MGYESRFMNVMLHKINFTTICTLEHFGVVSSNLCKSVKFVTLMVH